MICDHGLKIARLKQWPIAVWTQSIVNQDPCIWQLNVTPSPTVQGTLGSLQRWTCRALPLAWRVNRKIGCLKLVNIGASFKPLNSTSDISHGWLGGKMGNWVLSNTNGRLPCSSFSWCQKPPSLRTWLEPDVSAESCKDNTQRPHQPAVSFNSSTLQDLSDRMVLGGYLGHIRASLNE